MTLEPRDRRGHIFAWCVLSLGFLVNPFFVIFFPFWTTGTNSLNLVIFLLLSVMLSSNLTIFRSIFCLSLSYMVHFWNRLLPNVFCTKVSHVFFNFFLNILLYSPAAAFLLQPPWCLPQVSQHTADSPHILDFIHKPTSLKLENIIFISKIISYISCYRCCKSKNRLLADVMALQP